MAWNDKYWDILSNFYWTPRYLGLKSISRKNWRIDDEWISIPKALVETANGPLYFRSRKFDDLKANLHQQEEILNHLFNLTFSIAGDEVITELLCKPLGLDDQGPFESIGREVGRRYGWGPYENVTQQDGLFLSSRSAIGIELKLGSTSWPEQIAKYLALILWEAELGQPREHLGLLFIVPEPARVTHWANVGLKGPEIDAGFIDRLDRERLPEKIAALFEAKPEAVRAIASKLRLAVITWTEFQDSLKGYANGLNSAGAGEQTLRRLLDGLYVQINAHGATGINRAEVVGPAVA